MPGRSRLTAIWLANSEEIAKEQLCDLSRKTVYQGLERGIAKFAELAEWSGCRLIQVPKNRAINSKMYEPAAVKN